MTGRVVLAALPEGGNLETAAEEEWNIAETEGLVKSAGLVMSFHSL